MNAQSKAPQKTQQALAQEVLAQKLKAKANGDYEAMGTTTGGPMQQNFGQSTGNNPFTAPVRPRPAPIPDYDPEKNPMACPIGTLPGDEDDLIDQANNQMINNHRHIACTSLRVCGRNVNLRGGSRTEELVDRGRKGGFVPQIDEVLGIDTYASTLVGGKHYKGFKSKGLNVPDGDAFVGRAADVGRSNDTSNGKGGEGTYY